MSIARREFLKKSTVAGAGFLLASCASGKLTSTPRNRPNVVFIMTDDQPYDALSIMGHPVVETPAIDRLAREGVLFDNAFVTTSLCSPSRASILTGLHAHKHGVVGNSTHEFSRDTLTFPRILQRSGYETAFIGKWHMTTGRDTSPRPGFDHWVVMPGQGTYLNPILNVNGETRKHTGHMTEILTDYAVEWLEKDHSKPFCLCLWHKAAHQPFRAEEKHKGIYKDSPSPEPENWQEDFSDNPKWQRRIKALGGVKRKTYFDVIDKPVPDTVPVDKWNPLRKDRIDYFECLKGVDDSVDAVTGKLEELGLLDDTIIVYAADNGFFLGSHRLGDKRLMFEESIRIPLIMRYPERFGEGRHIEALALNIDLAPTLLALCGAPIPPSMQGRSLVGPLCDGNEEVREDFLYTYFREEKYPGLPLIHGVRSKKWTYVTYPDIEDIDELYDLEKDPYQLTNLALDPAHKEKVQEMKARLKQLLIEADYPIGEQVGAPFLTR